MGSEARTAQSTWCRRVAMVVLPQDRHARSLQHRGKSCIWSQESMSYGISCMCFRAFGSHDHKHTRTATFQWHSSRSPTNYPLTVLCSIGAAPRGRHATRPGSSQGRGDRPQHWQADHPVLPEPHAGRSLLTLRTSARSLASLLRTKSRVINDAQTRVPLIYRTAAEPPPRQERDQNSHTAHEKQRQADRF